MHFFRREQPAGAPRPPAPSDVFMGLRSQVLGLDPASVGIRPTHALPHVWGALLETAFPRGIATLVALADGTTSLYTSTGGGIIGGGAHAPVVAATHGFLATAEAALDRFDDDADTGLPDPGEAILRVLTFAGRRLGVRAPEEDFGYGRHPLSAVFHAGHSVITELRRIDQGR